MSWRTGGVQSSPIEEQPNSIPGSAGSNVVDRPSTSGSPSTTSTIAVTSPSPRRSGSALQSLKNFFGNASKEKAGLKSRFDAHLTTNGSIRKEVWEGLSSSCTREKRLDTLKVISEKSMSAPPTITKTNGAGIERSKKTQPQQSKLRTLLFPFIRIGYGSEVLRNRKLQVSTLEGVYHDMLDMLESKEEELREPALRLVVDLTETQQQHTDLGLALRQTFFEQIRTLGCEELTVKWLNALSQCGKNINGFEKDMDYLVADWVKITLSDKDNPQAALVLELTENFILHNAPFISQEAMSEILNQVCSRGCRTSEPLTQRCLKILSCVVKYSELPRHLLVCVISVICIQVCDSAHRDQCWNLAKALLTSQLGHRTRQNLQLLLDHSSSLHGEVKSANKQILLLRGAVFFLVNANWGTSQIDIISSPASIIPSLEAVMSKDVTICVDVFTALHRLISKYGRDLQPMTWMKLINLFETAITLIEQRKEYADKCEHSLQQLLLMTEQLYRDGQLGASPDMLFDLIERCADKRPDSSVIALIEYRTSNISPFVPDWIDRMFALIRRYGHEKQVIERRSKVINALHSLYTSYRRLYEHDLVTKLILPIMQNAATEKHPKVQYEMINVLFDVAKTVSLRGDSSLFQQVFGLIRQLLNHTIVKALPKIDEVEDISCTENESDRERNSGSDDSEEATSVTIDNLIIMARGVDDVLQERWANLNMKTFNILINILVEHIQVQYKADWNEDAGHEVRCIVMNSLLSVHCCPVTKRLLLSQREEYDSCPNVLLRRRFEGHKDGFVWTEICRTVTSVLLTDRNWSVIRECLEKLGRVLEHVQLIKTANSEDVENLAEALVNLYNRVETGMLVCPDGLLAKYLPPVLATLLNYTSRHESKNKEICRVLVNCIRSDQLEALMAIDVAVQLVPSLMGMQAMVLIEYLRQQPPSAKRAIPLIEFMSDSAEIPEFHRFFQEKHFRTVVDILAPYADIKLYNTYIVACVHRVLMRWYTHVPDTENLKNSVRIYIEQRIRDMPYGSVADGMHRQPSGDGRQVPGKIFLLGGDPSTPPPMDGIAGFREERGPESISDEIQRAMTAFFRLGRIDDSLEFKHASINAPSNLTEVSNDHYFINDCIVSITKYVDWTGIKEEDNENDVFSNDGEIGSPPECSTPSGGFLDQRRRHQSAIQERKTTRRESERPKALDDLYDARGPHRSRRNTISKAPILSFVQLTIRHMYGKSSWLMRGCEEWPADFERTANVPPMTSALSFHLLNTQGVMKLGKKGADEHLQRSLRNLDRVYGIEMHGVGVLYIGPHQNTEAAVLANTYGSANFANFVRLLGDPISLEKCPAGLEEGRHGTYTYEYKDALSRIVFLVATLMPNVANDANCNMKKKLIGNNFICIVFNESGQPFKLGSVCGQFVHVALEVMPCDAQSVLVTVHAKQEISCWLAMKRVLLNYPSAARLLRKLAVRTQLSVNVWRSMQGCSGLPYISNGVDRLRKILAIRDKMSSN